MRYLGLGLFAEGPSDYRFLTTLLPRVTNAVCGRAARDEVEVGPIQPLGAPKRFRGEDRPTQILEAMRGAEEGVQILFLHTDGAGDPEAARTGRVRPAAERLRQELEWSGGRTVAVVPVREMEAWPLADGEALRAAFETTLSAPDMGVPDKAKAVEQIPDPKKALDDAYAAVVGKRRGRRMKAVDFLEAIGEKVRLLRLRQVPAFQRLESDLETALRELRILR